MKLLVDMNLSPDWVPLPTRRYDSRFVLKCVADLFVLATP
jgi:hypothetical protein